MVSLLNDPLKWQNLCCHYPVDFDCVSESHPKRKLLYESGKPVPELCIHWYDVCNNCTHVFQTSLVCRVRGIQDSYPDWGRLPAGVVLPEVAKD